MNPLCACGCGYPVANSLNKYLFNHHRVGKVLSEKSKNKISYSMQGNIPWNKGKYGDINSRWNGGRIYTFEGYVCVPAHNHPNKNKWGYILEHRLLMENKTGV